MGMSEGKLTMRPTLWFRWFLSVMNENSYTTPIGQRNKYIEMNEGNGDIVVHGFSLVRYQHESLSIGEYMFVKGQEN
jgi:hypothetical protein